MCTGFGCVETRRLRSVNCFNNPPLFYYGNLLVFKRQLPGMTKFRGGKSVTFHCLDCVRQRFMDDMTLGFVPVYNLFALFGLNGHYHYAWLNSYIAYHLAT